MTVLVVILALALVAALAGIVVLLRRLEAARADVGRLEAALETYERQVLRDLPAPAPVKAAGRVVQTVMETATRVREQGVGGTLISSLDDFTRWALEDRTAIARVAGPDGTVTLFFSDIEGSTVLNNELGDARWVKVLAAHDQVVETYVEKYRGHVVKTQGDGHMVVFSTPDLALHAAVDIQRALNANWNRSRRLRRTPIRVRIGLHTGTAVEKGGDWFGQNVAFAARVAAQAQGGEVLVSDEVVQGAGEDFTFEAAEAIELKGFEGDHQLWRVQAG
ncbi:MAG TPA: adenylate/guanylate cyclase domain-containing protein [Marmoricola sp.]|nr:adenylate/guanylate cyclase domain-containing protein [Marmoricola sp.]